MKSLIKKLEKVIKSKCINPIKFSHIKLGVKCESKWYGNDYGGFYLNPNLINKKSIVYSFGIGEDISFDAALIHAHQCHVFGFDPTPKSIHWCEEQDLPKSFQFYDFGIAEKTGTAKFHLPINTEHVSGSLVLQNSLSEENTVEVKMKSFLDTLDILKHQKIDVLKMDIEGSEYDVIESILAAGIQIDQMAIEFHERFFENGKEKSQQLIEKMKRSGYEIFAISDSYEEISFIRTKAL